MLETGLKLSCPMHNSGDTFSEATVLVGQAGCLSHLFCPKYFTEFMKWSTNSFE
jgi:hypothetical protein